MLCTAHDEVVLVEAHVVGAGVGAGRLGLGAVGQRDADTIREFRSLKVSDLLLGAVVGDGFAVAGNDNLESILLPPLRIQDVRSIFVGNYGCTFSNRSPIAIRASVPAREVIIGRGAKAALCERVRLELRVIDFLIGRKLKVSCTTLNVAWVIYIIGDKNLPRLITPDGPEGDVAVDTHLILGLIHDTRAVGLGVPSDKDLPIGSSQALRMKHISIGILGVFVLIGGFRAQSTVSFICYFEFPCTDVVGIENDVGSDLNVEVVQGIGVVPIFAGTGSPTDELLALNLGGFTQLILIDGLTIGHAVNSLR